LLTERLKFQSMLVQNSVQVYLSILHLIELVINLSRLGFADAFAQDLASSLLAGVSKEAL